MQKHRDFQTPIWRNCAAGWSTVLATPVSGQLS
jgi:hypothetical protein